MNDIEILEEFIKYFEAEVTQIKYRRNISITVGEDDIEAIENLIQRNKELEQIEKEHKEENGRLRDRVKELEEIDLTTAYMNGLYDERDKWNIKIKRKIEEINNENLEIYNTDSDDVKIAKYEQRAILDFCKELLGE